MLEVYQHYKGGRYNIVCLARRESDLEPMVVYVSVSGGDKYVRTLKEFNEKFTMLKASISGKEEA